MAGLGALFLSIVWSLRLFARGEIIYYVLTICAGFFGILVAIPFNAYTFKKSKEENIAEFMIFREFLLFVSRMASFGIALLFVDHLNYAFAAAAAANLLFLFF